MSETYDLRPDEAMGVTPSFSDMLADQGDALDYTVVEDSTFPNLPSPEFRKT